jgi:Skp family chaperone for outer membrane proteins
MIFNKILMSSFIFVFLILFAPQVKAEQNSIPSPKIAIVDIQVILRDSLSSKEARKKMDAIALQEQTLLSNEESNLRKKDQKLQQQRAILAPDVFLKRQQTLQKEIRKLQKRSRNLNQALDKSFRKTINKIQIVLLDELRKLTEELNINIILPRSQIVIAVDDFEITKLALERLNKRLPSIDMKLEKNVNNKNNSK